MKFNLESKSYSKVLASTSGVVSCMQVSSTGLACSGVSLKKCISVCAFMAVHLYLTSE